MLLLLVLNVLDHGVNYFVYWHNVVNSVVLGVFHGLVDADQHLNNLLVAIIFVGTF